MSQWISIKDKLPDTCRRVLAMEESGYVTVCLYVPAFECFEEGEDSLKITHWVDLPTPLKIKTYWVNIYIDNDSEFLFTSNAYPSLDIAKEKIQNDKFIKTISFDIEE